MPINSPKKRILLRQAFEHFEARKYKEALASFSEALCLDSQDLEAKIGLILSDMAQDFPHEAAGFYELYQTMQKSNPRSLKKRIQQNILEAIEGFDEGLERVSAMLCDEKKLATESIEGILYSDFKQMCQRDGFKETFENLIFSTKIIFNTKEDFCDFLESLLSNGFSDYCLQYIENMRQSVGFDSKINAILQKLIKQETH